MPMTDKMEPIRSQKSRVMKEYEYRLTAGSPGGQVVRKMDDDWRDLTTSTNEAQCGCINTTDP